MSFLTERPIISGRVSLKTWIGYTLDVYFIVYVIGLSFLLRSLKDFSGHADQVLIAPGLFTALGGLGPYGFRIASYIAIARKLRMPQTAEWLCTLAGLAFAAVFFIGGGWMMEVWGSAHGYKYCFETGMSHGRSLYVRNDKACPNAPRSQDFISH